jgi:hypothetical protein
MEGISTMSVPFPQHIIFLGPYFPVSQRVISLSTEEQSSRRREQTTAIKRFGDETRLAARKLLQRV